MISKYLHVLNNRDIMINQNTQEIEKAIKLSRKKINPLSIECFNLN